MTGLSVSSAAGMLLYSTCAWLEDSASPFQPTLSTKPSESLNTQCSVLMLEELYPQCQKYFVVTKKPIGTHCKLPAESKNLFCHHDCWLNRLSETMSRVETITFGGLDFLWNFHKLIIPEMLVGIHLSRLTYCIHLHLGAYF